MANKSKWKRVLVTLPSGDKAYRYTDGKGTYRHLPPGAPPETREARHGLTPGRSGPPIRKQLEQMSGPAGGETRTARVNGKDTRSESRAPAGSNTPPAKPKPKYQPPAKNKPHYGPGGNPNGSGQGQAQQTPPRPQAPRSPAIGAPLHAKPAAFGSATKLQGGTLSAQPSVYAPQVGQAPKPNTPVASPTSSYRDGGKGLYKGSEEYVKATGGNYNPLMQRTFGYQTGGQPAPAQAPGTPPQSNDKVNTPDQRGQYVSPSGKPYAGPAYGNPPEQPMSPQYNGNDEPGALGQAENPLAALGQMLLQRKKLSISMSN